ncbi:NACHT domain-containing NTPase [Catenulispora sp. MAP5-51]|uniref:NACHT domain-containing protein n=1 Tax=unclassified Catenulispora TaxID=414885 RepID=UPI003510D602
MFAAVAGALGLGGVAALSVKQLITPSLNRAGASFAEVLTDYLAVLRSRSLRRIRRYQRSVAEYAREHTLGFGTEPISVRDVYVPLAAVATGERRDLYEAIRGERRSVVIGEAGAGKSMLLKHSLLEWTERHTTRRSEIPVLVELRRFNSGPADAIDLVAQVQEFLHTHRFKGAAGFVTKALEDGRITVLFDGLDEVTADRLDGVVQKLKDFAQRFTDCQIVVTCRSSLYNGELDFRTVVRVAELDDATIRLLLHRWPGLDAASQERLYRTLGANAALKRLARSPLLLSMMAWMTTSGIALPTSRADFYDTAIENLVRRDDVLKRGRSQFAANKKLVVLRGIALVLQDRAGADRDRLNISHASALEHIRSIAASIDLDEKDAEPLLAEIVERSELLSSSGGVAPSYFFRHLTFQEYLAAVELRDDREGLLDRYVTDRNAWRETVKLWCGRADRDATPLIRYLLDHDGPGGCTMALECVSATTRVGEAIVRETVDLLEVDLVRADGVLPNPEVILAFGNAAAGSGPRSALIRDRLFELARSGSDFYRAEAAMEALAASGHESAAEFLASGSTTSDISARIALVSMGDLAIPALCRLAESGDLNAVDDLAGIATPAAIEALVGLLIRGLEPGMRAAWRLAERLGDAVAVEVIARGPGTQGPSGGEWVWERFSGGSSTLNEVVAWVFSVVNGCPVEAIPKDVGRIDFRFVVASVVVDHGNPRLWVVPDRIVELTDRVLSESHQVVAPPGAKLQLDAVLRGLQELPALTSAGDDLRRALLDHYQLSPNHTAMVEAMGYEDQLSILLLLGSPHPRSEWTAMPTVAPKRSYLWPGLIACAVLAAVFVMGAAPWQEFEMMVGHRSFGPRALVPVSWLVLLGLYFAPRLGFISRWARSSQLLLAGLTTLVVVSLTYQLLIGTIATARLIGLHPTWIVAVGVPLTLLALHAQHRNKRYNNPLRKAIEAAGATSPTTSIIASTPARKRP